MKKSELRKMIKEEIQKVVKEIEFPDAESYNKYKSQHKMRSGTKVTVGGKETTVGNDSGDETKKPKRWKKESEDIMIFAATNQVADVILDGGTESAEWDRRDQVIDDFLKEKGINENDPEYDNMFMDLVDKVDAMVDEQDVKYNENIKLKLGNLLKKKSVKNSISRKNTIGKRI